jgi:Protein of unknown function (DUF559)
MPATLAEWLICSILRPSQDLKLEHITLTERSGSWRRASTASSPAGSSSRRGFLRRSWRAASLADACWPAHDVVVELDGWAYRHDRHAFERDRERDAHLHAAGHRVVRFTHHQVTRRPAHVIEVLRRLGL